jgi:hypothetical protein
LYSSYIKVLVDAAIHSEDGKIIKCNFKPGSVERSIDPSNKEGIPQQAICSMSATNKN